MLVDDPNELIEDPSIDVIVEVMGGIDIAKDIIMQSLRAGKSVVTANKAVIARYGSEIYEAAAQKGMLVLTTPQSGTDVTAYTRITTVNDSNTITLSNGMSNAANTIIYIYQSRGLVDNSLVTFCPQTGSATTRCHLLPVQFNGSDIFQKNHTLNQYLHYYSRKH